MGSKNSGFNQGNCSCYRAVKVLELGKGVGKRLSLIVSVDVM